MTKSEEPNQTNIDAGDISDVGRDANVAGGNIVHAAEGSTVIIGASAEAVGGFVALRELMQRSTDVRNAVIEFQTDFKMSREQVDQLGDYKDLHDLLHRLQFTCYNSIVHAAAEFPADEQTLEILTDHLFTFEGIVDELKQVASRASLPDQELRWIVEAEQMKNDLRITITTLDEKKLKNVIGRLNRLLSTHLPRINTLLNHAARALRLPELWGALGRVCKDLTSPDLDPDKVRAFQSGVDALGTLEKTLSALVDEHDRWQTLEVELRLIETLITSDLDQFGMDWPVIKQKAEPLFTARTAEWAIALRADTGAMDAALSGNNPAQARRSFRNYQRRVSNRFYQIDLELKALCGNLRQIGVPLTSVLEMIK